MTDVKSNDVLVLSLTDTALTKVLELQAAEGRDERLALWVRVSGVTDGSFAYEMYFEAAADAGDEDWSDERDGLVVVVPTDSVEQIRGSVLDMSRNLLQGGMVIQNPNTPPLPTPAMAGPPADLSGDVAQRVIQVLDQQINPSIATHGGRADLVAVDDDAAFLRLSGGCAGCGMAAVTLSQGIEVAIRDSVPEILRVVDVTDHAAGTNPYYEPAKK